MDTIEALGWRNFFASQLEPGSGLRPARVMAVHRDRLDVAGAGDTQSVVLAGRIADQPVAIGDWVLLDESGERVERVLERFGVFKRGAAGPSHTVQLIAANVDTVFVVTSANRDFNIARLERYLAIAQDAGAFPVVVITKADTVDSTADFVREASALSPGLLVEAVNALDPDSVSCLRSWCGVGQTVALLGSSGVGKSTLVNTLSGAVQDTGAVREDDQRGRHTTTNRSMHPLPDGGWLMDTPGMRELQLVDVGDALDDVFTDVSVLAEQCRFGDCQHESEPGCAVQAAIEGGELDADRLRRYRKLVAEDRRNTESTAERRARDKTFHKMVKTVMADKQRTKGG